MKIHIEQKDLIEALNIVNRAINPNNTLQVLNNILINARDSKLFFTATNLEIAINHSISANIEKEGSITIPAKLFINYVSLMKSGEISISIEDNLTLLIEAGSEKCKIKGIAIEEFPLIPVIEKENQSKITTKDVKCIADEVCFAASNNIARPVLMGVLFEIKDGICKAVATDSYRLSEKKLENSGSTISCIIPSKTILELSKIIGQKDKEVLIYISKNQVLFETENTSLTSRLIEGSFPDYEKIIPQTSKTTFEINRAELFLSVKKVSLFSLESNAGIKMKVDGGAVVLESMESQFGEGRTELAASISGENNEISLNGQFLLDILSQMKEDLVLVKIDGKLSPVTITEVKERSLTHIIMPLRA